MQLTSCLSRFTIALPLTMATILAIAALVMNSIEGLKLVMISIEGLKRHGCRLTVGEHWMWHRSPAVALHHARCNNDAFAEPFTLPCAFRSDRSTSSSLHANGDPRCQR